jgi:hypothetical protein
MVSSDGTMVLVSLAEAMTSDLYLIEYGEGSK